MTGALLSNRRDREPGAQALRVQVADGVVVVADLVRGPTRFALLVLPGFWRSRHSSRIRSLADRLAAISSTVVVDLRGHGDSTGTYTFGTLEPADVGHVMSRMHELGYSDIGILGLSLGGYIGMEAARSFAPPGVRVHGAALVSSPTEVKRARPMFFSPKALRQLQPSEILRRPRFDPTYLPRRRQNAAVNRPPTETFPVTIYQCRGDWLIPDREARDWAQELGARATLVLYEDRRRLHADALLGPNMPLADQLEAWWRKITSA